MSVVIATLDRPDQLRESLRAALEQTPPPLEVLVVDGSPARTAVTVTEAAAAAAAAAASVTVRHVSTGAGLTRQRNCGLDLAGGDVVVFIDDDALLLPGALGALLSSYDDPAVVGATGRVEEPASHRWLGQRSRLRLLLRAGGAEGTMTRYGYPRRIVHADRATDVQFLSGCFMSARTELAREVRFDEALSGYGLAEDEDFGWRLGRRGRMRYVPTAVVQHANAGFGSRDRRSFNRTVVVHRSYLFRKNFPQTRRARLGFGWLLAVLFVHRALTGDARGMLGLVDGIRAVRNGAVDELAGR